MADTIREQSAILTLFADNASRAISEQDLRDFVKSAMSPKAKWTPEGGLAIKLTNKTGSASVKGRLVAASSTVDNATMLPGTTAYDMLGFEYDVGVADGSDYWVVVQGIAEALVDNSQAVARRDLIVSSTSTSGRVDVEPIVPPVSTNDHFRECGHAITATSAGTDKTFFLVIHFN